MACTPQETSLFETTAIVLLIVWLLGLLSSTMLGGAIHLLFIVAVMLIALGYVDGRRI
jgi:hypothetical protein